jgi:hypothetical protein
MEAALELELEDYYQVPKLEVIENSKAKNASKRYTKRNNIVLDFLGKEKLDTIKAKPYRGPTLNRILSAASDAYSRDIPHTTIDWRRDDYLQACKARNELARKKTQTLLYGNIFEMTAKGKNEEYIASRLSKKLKLDIDLKTVKKLRKHAANFQYSSLEENLISSTDAKEMPKELVRYGVRQELSSFVEEKVNSGMLAENIVDELKVKYGAVYAAVESKKRKEYVMPFNVEFVKTVKTVKKEEDKRYTRENMAIAVQSLEQAANNFKIIEQNEAVRQQLQIDEETRLNNEKLSYSSVYSPFHRAISALSFTTDTRKRILEDLNEMDRGAVIGMYNGDKNLLRDDKTSYLPHMKTYFKARDWEMPKKHFSLGMSKLFFENMIKDFTDLFANLTFKKYRATYDY